MTEAEPGGKCGVSLCIKSATTIYLCNHGILNIQARKKGESSGQHWVDLDVNNKWKKYNSESEQ